MTAGVAIFDLDETITLADTNLRFVLSYLGHADIGVADRLSSLARGLRAFADQRVAKNLILGLGLAGQPYQAVSDHGAAFAARLAERGLKRDAIAAIERRRAAGDALVLASASLDLYVEPLGRILKFDQVVATRTAKCAAGRLMAKLQGRNCKGVEKLRRVLELTGRAALRERGVVYSDSFSDLPLMTAAARGVFIGDHGRAIAARARAHGLNVENWS